MSVAPPPNLLDSHGESQWDIVRRMFRRKRTAVWGLRVTLVLIFIALYNQPRAVRLPVEVASKSRYRRRDAYQPADLEADGCPNRDRCSKRKPAKPERNIRVAILYPGENCQRIIKFANAVVVAAFAALGTAEVEAQCYESRSNE